jgi:hypothetical protein
MPLYNIGSAKFQTRFIDSARGFIHPGGRLPPDRRTTAESTERRIMRLYVGTENKTAFVDAIRQNRGKGA